MKKKFLSLLLATTICFGILPASASASHDFSDAELKATALKSLNLFQGVSSSDFALDQTPTRAQALVMFIRMIGAENAAKNNDNYHPFTDVPSWADSYVGYAYQHGYTNGVTPTRFGTEDAANSAMYLTFTLRALGYSDAGGTDFTWDNPFALARTTKILDDSVDTKNFLRADIALISWKALTVPMNGGNKALADLLIMAGVFTQSQYDGANNLVKNGVSSSASTIKMGKYTCNTDVNGFTYDSVYRPTFTLYSNKTFDVTVNFGEGMANGHGNWTSLTLSSGETAVYLSVNTNEWIETYYLVFLNGNFILTDEWMGITAPNSVYYFDGVK